MMVCVQCRTEMLCDKNGVGCVCGVEDVYPGDRYKCPECGALVVKTNNTAICDPDRETQDEYLEIST